MMNWNNIQQRDSTYWIVDPKNYVHGSSFVVFCCGKVSIYFTHILQDSFTGTMGNHSPSASEASLKNMGTTSLQLSVCSMTMKLASCKLWVFNEMEPKSCSYFMWCKLYINQSSGASHSGLHPASPLTQHTEYKSHDVNQLRQPPEPSSQNICYWWNYDKKNLFLNLWDYCSLYKLKYVFINMNGYIATKNRIYCHQKTCSLKCTLQYIYTWFTLSCFVVARYQPILPISFRLASLALGQSYDCPSASEASLKNMGTTSSATRDNEVGNMTSLSFQWNLTKIAFIFHGM